MAGKAISPETLAEAMSLRAAGFTVAAIAARLHVSVRTLNRVFARHGAVKGKLRHELIEEAQRDLMEAITSNERIKTEAARIVMDDLAHARLLRERVAAAYELMTPSNLEEAALCMRAAAAAATTLKVSSDMMRRSLRTEKVLDEQQSEDLPELRVIEITAEEALRLRETAPGGPVSTSAPDTNSDAAKAIVGPSGTVEGEEQDDRVIEDDGEVA